jgi:cutinase
MKLITSLLAAFATTIFAAPATELEARQTVGTTENEFTRYGCRDVIFFFARGSTEVGNMVLLPVQISVLI